MPFSDLYEQREAKVISKLLKQKDFWEKSDMLQQFIDKLVNTCSTPEEREEMVSVFDELMVGYLNVIQKFMYSMGAADILSLMLIKENSNIKGTSRTVNF